MSSPQLPYPGFRPNFDTCTEVTPYCPVEITTYGDYFNLGACIFFTVFHALLLISQLGIGIRYRTWTFTVFLAIGTGFELMGYGARISMTPIGTVWSYPAFVIQLLMLILGPTLVAAAISVTFKWIVIQCGERYSIMKPKWYPWVFLGTDFASIIIQAIGGAVSAVATDGNTNSSLLDVGSGLLVAGTAFQAANMVFCGGLIVIYFWRYQRALKRGDLELNNSSTSASTSSAITPGANGVSESGTTSPSVSGEQVIASQQPKTTHTSSSGSEYSLWQNIKPVTRFRVFLWAIFVAYMAIITRCVYRIPEMASGWGSTLMQTESLFLAFDGGAVALACLLLTVFHPALFFPIMRKGKKSPQRKAAAEKEANEKQTTPVDVEAEAEGHTQGVSGDVEGQDPVAGSSARV